MNDRAVVSVSLLSYVARSHACVRDKTAMSSLAQRRRTAVLGSKRWWWQGGCWATRSHQEAYLRKLYARKNENCTTTISGDQNNEDATTVQRDFQSPWSPSVVYDLPTTDEHYLDAFLRNRDDDEDNGNNDIVNDVVGCPALATSRASPTEKCVEYLKGAHENRTSFGDRRASGDAECGRIAECNSTHSGYDAAGCSE